ncbi:MAG: hypothetical protein WAX69_06935 [Victivallales bacterium]
MFEQAFRNIDDILRKESGCATELDYTEQTSWLLFMKYLDKPYRRDTWAAPKGKDGKLDHNAALSGDDLRETRRLESICQQKFAALEELKKSLLNQAFTGGM